MELTTLSPLPVLRVVMMTRCPACRQSQVTQSHVELASECRPQNRMRFISWLQLRGSKGCICFIQKNLTKRSNAIIINNTNLERMPCTHEREKLWTRPVANVCFAQKQMFCHGKRLFLLENKRLPASLLGTHTVGLSTSAHRFTVDVDIDLLNLLCVRLASCDILLHPVPKAAQIWTGWLGVSSSTKPGNEKTGRLMEAEQLGLGTTRQQKQSATDELPAEEEKQQGQNPT